MVEIGTVARNLVVVRATIFLARWRFVHSTASSSSRNQPWNLFVSIQ